MIMFETLINTEKKFKLSGPLPDEASGDLEADIHAYFPVESWEMDESSFSFSGDDWSVSYKKEGGNYVISVKGEDDVVQGMKEILSNYKVGYEI